MVKAGKPANVARPEGAGAVQRIELPNSLAVRQLAEALEVDVIDIIKRLMRNGIMANINQVLDFDTARAIVRGYGYEARLKPQPRAGQTRRQRPPSADKETLQPRPPVVTVMGHVDHGKTRLLDAIRQTNVMEGEAGGITQHIGAYQVTINGQKITFLDTPGHEAFTNMRAHGAQITDITILVVAADDGVMPQTQEAISHARAAGVPIVVAINKIDKPNANPDLVKQQLADAGLVVEEWGGDVICVPISAKEKLGIEELLENLLVVAEMEDLMADPSRPAIGVVIEARMDKAKGSLATVLVQSGTLRPGDTVVVGTTWGRVRALFNDQGKRVKKAEPATPIEILGLNSVPQAGDTLVTVPDDREAQALVERRKQDSQETSLAARGVNLHNLHDQISSGRVKELNVIIKTDVQGSLEPIRASLERLATDKVKVRIIHSGTGRVTESDVMLAIASKGLVLGFGVDSEEGAKRLAATRGVDIRHYNVIYSLIDEMDKALKGMLDPVYEEVVEGQAEVRAVFAAKGNKIAGVYVTQGKVSRGATLRVRRGAEVILEQGAVSSLKRFKDDVKEAVAGYECGIGIKDFNDVQVGDVLEFYKSQKVT